MFQPMQHRWQSWVADSPRRAAQIKSPQTLFNALFDDNATPGLSTAIGDVIDRYIAPNGSAQKATVTGAQAPAEPEQSINSCFTSRYVCSGCKGGNALPKSEALVLEELKEARQTIQDQQARLEALERFHLAHAPWHAPSAKTGSVTALDESGYKSKRMQSVWECVEEVIRIKGKCEPDKFFEQWYSTKQGYSQLHGYATKCLRWNGHKWEGIAAFYGKRGYLQGHADFRDSLKQDKFRTLYVADVCDLSDRKHSVMLRVTGLQRILAGTTQIKHARSIMNDQVQDMLGLSPTPGGTGWQVEIGQLARFILAQMKREGADVDAILRKCRGKLEFRITYDGAEVGGHPGLIAYVVPMNLGHSVESAKAAYPVLFTRCKENNANIKAEMGDMVKAIIETRDGAGIEFGGQKMKIDWWQSMDLASFWKQLGLTFNCNEGYCPWCKCTHKDDHDFGLWTGSAEPNREMVLPIPLSKTVFCATHAKMRVVGKLMNLLAAEAVKQDRVQQWVEAVRSLNIPCFNVTTRDSEGNPHAPTTTALIGPHCNDIIRNYRLVVAASGVSNYERIQGCFKQFGPGEPTNKTVPQLKNCLSAARVKFNKSASNQQCLDLYHNHYGTDYHCCTDHCNQLCGVEGDGDVVRCPVSGYRYNKTNDLSATLRVWEAFSKVNIVLRQLEQVTPEQLAQYEIDVGEFGEAFVAQYSNTGVTCYIHMIVCHSVQLIRQHGSIGVFANQGVEAAHKLIRQKLNRSARGGGRYQKAVSLSILERHYRIELLRLVYEHEVKVDMVEVEAIHAEEAKQGGWVELGASFMELKEDIGELDMSEHKECRVTKRVQAPIQADMCGETFTITQDNGRRKLQHKGESAAAVTLTPAQPMRP